jgi:hypothetical protein
VGSVIEIKFKDDFRGIWFFQSNFPTRYSEIQTDFPGGQTFRFIPRVKQPYVKNIGEANDFKQIKALANIRSMPDEPFMGAKQNSLQRIEYFGVSTNYGTWPKIGELLLRIYNADQNIDTRLPGETEILKQVKALKSDDEKIAFIYDHVKSNVKWNNIRDMFAQNGATTVWEKKIGNSAEINWMVFHLLKKAGIKAYPMVVSDKSVGKLNPTIPDPYMLVNMIVYVPVDTTHTYVLDGTNKYNLYNQIPVGQLNTFGLNLDDDNKFFQIPFLENQEPAMQSVFLNAEIKPDDKMSGTAEINSYSYHKIDAVTKYNTDGEEKYIKYLRGDDNNLAVTSFKLENMDVDTLPLTQKIVFNDNLSSSDESYIYFTTNLFNLMGENPFKSEERFSDIDFGYRKNFSINGIYKLPAGYKTDAMPKNVTIVMPDESIVFKRTVVEDEGTILVKYVLNHKKSLYFMEDYQDIRGFYKKMYELMAEQVVLKKI